MAIPPVFQIVTSHVIFLEKTPLGYLYHYLYRTFSQPTYILLDNIFQSYFSILVSFPFQFQFHQCQYPPSCELWPLTKIFADPGFSSSSVHSKASNERYDELIFVIVSCRLKIPHLQIFQSNSILSYFYFLCKSVFFVLIPHIFKFAKPLPLTRLHFSYTITTFFIFPSALRSIQTSLRVIDKHINCYKPAVYSCLQMRFPCFPHPKLRLLNFHSFSHFRIFAYLNVVSLFSTFNVNKILQFCLISI